MIWKRINDVRNREIQRSLSVRKSCDELMTRKEEAKDRWRDHFAQLLNKYEMRENGDGKSSGI